jgi:hypothetical protein
MVLQKMGDCMKSSLALTTFWAAALACSACDPAKALDINEMFVSNFSVTESTSGVDITVPGKVYIGADITVESAPIIRIHAIADLSDLQRKLPSIMAKVPLPSSNCATFSPLSAKNMVVSLSTYRLGFSNGEALFHAEGSAEIWSCIQNPVPNTKIDMCMKDIKVLGRTVTKTKVPCVHTWPGDPIKATLGSQPFSLDLPFGLKLVDGATVQLAPGEAKMNLNGQYANITKDVLNAIKVNINDKLNDAIQHAIDTKKITSSIPSEFVQAGFSFQNVKFSQLEPGNLLGLDISADIKVTSATLKEVARLLYEAIKNKV